MPNVDVIIVNYRSAAHSAACAAAALAVAREDGVEVNLVIVNNGDDPQILEDQASHDPAVSFVHNETNLGFGAACNIGAARGSAPFVLFLNPDARLKRGYFKTVLAFMTDAKNAAVGIVGPAIENESGDLTPTCSTLPSVARLLGRSLGVVREFLPNSAHNVSGHVGQVMGAVLLIRRKLLEELGGFDSRYFLYYEDVDLCARAAAKGALTHYLATAHAMHIGRVSSSQDTGMALALFLRSRLTYARLHFGAIAQVLLGGVSFIAELPLRLAGTIIGGKRITGVAVLRAYRLLTWSLLSGTSPAELASRARKKSGAR